MEIMLNGKKINTNASSAFELRKRTFPKDSIIIYNGFQISEDLELSDGDNICIISKGELPPQDELEAMMAARHTPKVHKNVKCAKVAVCGLGGLGSNIAVMLARTGIGFMRLIDFDIVEPSNLNRQCYYTDHLGRYKAEALKEQIVRINPYIEIEAVTKKIDENNIDCLLSDIEIICEAFDSPSAKAMLTSEILYRYPKKKIVAASGMAGYESSNLIQTAKKMKNLYVCGDLENEAKPGSGLMAPRVNICAGHQANMILRLIMGIDIP